MNKINVGLYGGKSIFGGKETPLEAEIIYCDKYDKCSYYENKKCLKIRSLSGGCKFGKKNRIKGYTSRAKKYYDFKQKYSNDSDYNKLYYPETKLGIIDNFIVFPYSYVCINDDLTLDDPWKNHGKISFIDKDKFDVTFIYNLCTFRPHALMGGIISDYQNKIVPLFLSHLKEVLPNLYKEFINTYKEFDKEIDYTGRKALLKTINPSYIENINYRYPDLNSKWYWDGEFLIYKEGYISTISSSITDNYEIEEFKIKPTDKSTVEITSNNQINKNTIFID